MTIETSTAEFGGKVIRIGMTAERNSVYAKIKYHRGRLSITGVEGPLPGGNCKGGAGQCVDACTRVVHFAPGWSTDLVTKFVAVWNRWHLNDMKAGSAVQEKWLRDNHDYTRTSYDLRSLALEAAGLNPDADGYKYGSAWKREAVPVEVIRFMLDLPSTDRTPPWV